MKGQMSGWSTQESLRSLRVPECGTPKSTAGRQKTLNSNQRGKHRGLKEGPPVIRASPPPRGQRACV